VSKRNLYWLIAVVVVGVVLWLAVSWLAGVIGAAATLVVSETVERTRRRRRGGSGQLRSAITTKRGKPGAN
jgi:uncharacterized protein involved in cysteine biosynthesis